MRQHVERRSRAEETCCKEEPTETKRPGRHPCKNARDLDSTEKLYKYIECCGGKLDPGWRSVRRCCPGNSFYYTCYPPQGFKPAHGSRQRQYKSFPDVARAIGVHPIGGRQEGQHLKRCRPAASSVTSHKRQKKLLPPVSPEASARVSVTPSDCLPPDQVADYPGKPCKKDNPGNASKADNPGIPRKKGAKFMSLNALANTAPATGPGHEPRDQRRVRGSTLLAEYPTDTDTQSSELDEGGSHGRQGTDSECTKQEDTSAGSDALCECPLAKMLDDVKLNASGPDISESHDAAKELDKVPEDDMSAGQTGAQQNTCMTREAIWTGEQHVSAPAGDQGQVNYITRTLADAGLLPTGEQIDSLCTGGLMNKDPPTAVDGTEGAALQQGQEKQGGKHSSDSASEQARSGPQVGNAADAEMQHGGNTQSAAGRSKAQGDTDADFQQRMDEQLKTLARAAHGPGQKAQAKFGDGIHSSSQPGWPPVVQTAAPHAAADMPAADAEKAPHDGAARFDRHNRGDVLHQGNGSGEANDKNRTTDSDGMNGEGLERVIAFLLQANGSLYADNSPTRPDSPVAAHITELQNNNHVLRFELAEQSRLHMESSRAKDEQLAELERQLAVTNRQLAQKTREYSALAAGVEEAIRGVSAIK